MYEQSVNVLSTAHSTSAPPSVSEKVRQIFPALFASAKDNVYPCASGTNSGKYAYNNV